MFQTVRFPRHSGQYFGQRRVLDEKVKVFPHFGHFLVRVSAGWCFALHSGQQSGQLWTSSGSVKVFPQILHVLVIIPGCGASGCLSPPAISFFNHLNINSPAFLSFITAGLILRCLRKYALKYPLCTFRGGHRVRVDRQIIAVFREQVFIGGLCRSRASVSAGRLTRLQDFSWTRHTDQLCIAVTE